MFTHLDLDWSQYLLTSLDRIGSEIDSKHVEMRV